MKLKILAFGIAKEILSGNAIEIESGPSITVSELKSVLSKKYPDLTRLNSYMIAVNDEYAGDDKIISDKDEIAIIPPVSGG